MDKARSPLAKYVITFDAVPPAQLPTKTKPAVSWLESWSAYAKSIAIRGIRKNWRETPIKTVAGFFLIRKKSCLLRVKPIRNITEASRNTTASAAAENNSLK